ncbi:uncharacterized protein LOC135936774 [Cloeon dipterum]|uniref:uncharacterized protein LOC135936774 n=1 Tax=Cloeon dipterum TaxID=197152 RepID=UPI0032208E0E
MSAFFAAILFHGLCLANAVNFTTVYEWDQFYVTQDSSGKHICTTSVLFHYMAFFGERLFLSQDIYGGISATLLWLPTSGTSTKGLNRCDSPKSHQDRHQTSTDPPMPDAFPSWDLHKEDNCDSIQWARGLETDPDGRLWVLDQGSINCSSKIWIFDLLNNDKTELIHQFPDTVVSHTYRERWLLDIVLDKTPDDFLAYITDSYSEHIVVYSRKTDKSWSVRTTGRKWFSLALSPNREARQLYLGRHNSKELYSLSVSELRNEGGNATIKFIGQCSEEPTRMLFNNANVLYATFYQKNFVSMWNISEPFREQRLLELGVLDNKEYLNIALDTNGSLWMTLSTSPGVEGTRFKILKAAVGARSYLFSSSSALPTPQVNERSRGCAGLEENYRKSQSLVTILIWLLVFCAVLSGTVIAWLTLKMKRMQPFIRRNSEDNLLELIPNNDETCN